MAAVLVRLKITLLRRSWQREGNAFLGIIAGCIAALFFTGLGVAGLVLMRFTNPVDAQSLTVPALATLTLGWIVGPILMFGSDETLDPGRFALLPLRARDLRPGLTLAGLLGLPGIALVVLALAQVVTWARGPLAVVVAILGGALGVATCFLLSRLVTTMFTQALASRRMRDVTAVLLGIFAAGAGLTNQFIRSAASSAESATHEGALHTTAVVTGWTPLAWAWSAPAEVATGHAWQGLGKLALAGGLAVALWAAWGHFLDRALTSPLTAQGGSEVSSRGLAARLSRGGPTTAIMGRCLRYWRRDPRYLSALASCLVVPVVVGFGSLHSSGTGLFVLPVFVVAMGIPTLMADLAYDNSAFWLHVSSGVSMRADRWGRMLALATILVPLALVVDVVLAVVTGHWESFVWSLAVLVAVAGVGYGIAMVVGAHVPGQAPAPGESSFARRNSGGGFLVMMALFGSWAATALVASPVIVLAALGHGVIALVVAPFLAGTALVVGARLGATQLERTQPEVLARITS